MAQSYFESIVNGFRTLIFDSSCIGCGLGSESICRTCTEYLTAKPEEISGENFKIYSGLIYTDAAAQTVLAAKEDGNRLARKILANSIGSSLHYMVKKFTQVTDVSLVPIPSAAAAIRRRGGDFLLPIARQAISMTKNELPGTLFEVKQILQISRKVKDQSKLSALERAENLRFAFESTGKLPNSPIVLIDDVVTTGSTLREAYRALRERNLTVLGAVTACASGRRIRIR